MTDIGTAIIRDIFENHRGFLPGTPPSVQDVRSNMQGSVRFGELTPEEESLLLSVLPKYSSDIWLVPLDKGLSGARVLAARYRLPPRRLSKTFVLKVGDKGKIQREARAHENFVAPVIPGIEAPVVRIGPTQALLASELRGFAVGAAPPLSLRQSLLRDGPALSVLEHLFTSRLSPWYASEDSRGFVDAPAHAVLSANLRRGPALEDQILPDGWEDFPAWVASVVPSSWKTVREIIRDTLQSSISCRYGTIHGDLHCQNVLVDDHAREGWPIDFGWCTDEAAFALDLAMLECSIKFNVIPARSDVRSVLPMEVALNREMLPDFSFERVPYSPELNRCLAAIKVTREYFLVQNPVTTFEHYRKILFLMTYCLSTLAGLNLPLILASLQVQASLL